MAERTRYVIMRDAFDQTYTLDTKMVRNIGARVKYTMTWDAFVRRPEKASKESSSSK